tara:strand:- start:1152 stop:1628 length:477 start_codon:yes stop_codon:yes gene_type:complete
MRNIDVNEVALIIPELSLSELRALEMSIQVAIRMRSQGELSTDTPEARQRQEEGPGLDAQATSILQQIDLHDLTLADQALLAALILSDGYQQETFSSRDINDIIAENGRPRVAHITSAISGLISRSFLTGGTKALSLSKEGKAKARGLIAMIQRQAAA